MNLGHSDLLLWLAITSSGKILIIKSSPKASNGQRFPCPALYWPRTSFEKQGSGPDSGRSPVEWGDFVRTSVRHTLLFWRKWGF